MTLNEALLIIETDLGEPSKMKGFSFGLPAKSCITGTKLHNVPDTVCSKCYALRGNYGFPHVVAALDRRLQGITHPQWVEAMIFLIHRRSSSSKLKKNNNNSNKHRVNTHYFRFHDSGDIQSLDHLIKIVDIAKQCKDIRFWLPTREFAIVKEWIANGGIRPKNLIIRLSASIINGPLPFKLAKELGVLTSGVHKKGFILPKNIRECEAHTRENYCGPCSACWDGRIKAISYPLH